MKYLLAGTMRFLRSHLSTLRMLRVCRRRPRHEILFGNQKTVYWVFCGTHEALEPPDRNR